MSRGVVALALGAAALSLPVVLHDDAPTAGQEAVSRLQDDAPSGVTSVGAAGDLRWATTKPGATIDNPDVTDSMSPTDAARAHLQRYGAAFGIGSGDAHLRVARSTRAASGQVTVFRQDVSGVPVIASGVSVETAPDGQLRSVLADVSDATSVPDAVVPEDTAARAAQETVTARDGAGTRRLAVRRDGRALYDPVVIGAEATLGRHTVWSFTVSSGPGFARSVLVDDQTGGVVADLDATEALDRVVCDNNNVINGSTIGCSGNFARTEGSAPSGAVDADRAYDILGAASAFYASVGGIDLTDLLGRDVAGTKQLASTVRYCESGMGTCPMANAFWDSDQQQMFTGSGYAVDDVVGHEMTHGVIDKYAGLFYWGQSGAINEGLADVMGEQVDRSLALPGEPADDWLLGEQVPGGAGRSIKDPTTHGQPDRTGSSLYSVNPNDNGGVHTDSGILLKTFYLASQGGTFNGHTVTGIDDSDPTTAKSRKLWWQALIRLVPGSDFADLGLVLDQACGDLVGSAGFTAATCAQVHEAGLATELAATPVKAPQPADAPRDCPTGRTPRTLLSSESMPSAFADASGAGVAGWVRDVRVPLGENAHSGHDSWGAYGSTPRSTSVLRATTAVTPPAGQPAYLRFQQWRYLDADAGYNYDMGTVELAESAYGPLLGETFPASAWINGPTDSVRTGQGNPAETRKGYAGDSRGWVASRLDISALAGHPVRPQFGMSTDQVATALPWYLDDIEIYTCDPATSASPSGSVTASPTTTSPSASVSPSTTASTSPSATTTATASATQSSSPSTTVSPTTTSSATTSPTPSGTASETPSGSASPTTTQSPDPPATPPGTPVGFTVRPARTDLGVVVAWSAPSTTGSGVTGYELRRSDGQVWTFPAAGGLKQVLPSATTYSYWLRTLGVGGTSSALVKRVVFARSLSLGSLPTAVRHGTTLTLTGTLKQLPGGAAYAHLPVTAQYRPAGSTTWRSYLTSTGAVRTGTTSSTGTVSLRVAALRGSVSYRLYAVGGGTSSSGWLRVASTARTVRGR